jgi:hypothetical protein
MDKNQRNKPDPGVIPKFQMVGLPEKRPSGRNIQLQESWGRPAAGRDGTERREKNLKDKQGENQKERKQQG